MSEVTRILEAAQQGDPTAADELLPLVYDELRRLATHKMANEVPRADTSAYRSRSRSLAPARWQR